MRQLEFDLWGLLETAVDEPEAADLSVIWRSLDQTLEPLTVRSQLMTAGQAVSQIAEVIQARSLLIFEEIESFTQDEGPIMPPGVFDRFVRQSMQVDFGQFLESTVIPPRLRSSEDPETDLQSTVQEMAKAELLELLPEELVFDELEAKETALAVAHGEDISDWVREITTVLQTQSELSLTELRSQIARPLIELWLGLLLGGFHLGRSQPPQELDFVAFCRWFYESEVWIVGVLEPQSLVQE
ncbi:MAG: hypothetical protein VKJ24_00070 [Synechococcales bacterium]|nr:hypothetical protein [Synechococcales bacterium]